MRLHTNGEDVTYKIPPLCPPCVGTVCRIIGEYVHSITLPVSLMLLRTRTLYYLKICTTLHTRMNNTIFVIRFGNAFFLHIKSAYVRTKLVVK